MSTVSEDLKIEIRPIPDRGGIRSFSKNLEYFSQPNTIMAFVDPATRKYKTGLSDADIKYLEEIEFPYNIKDTYIQGVAHEFWESLMTKTELKSTPQFLYPGQNVFDFIKYKYLLVNAYIYKSEEEMLSGSKPEATHYIHDESEAVEIKATKIEKKNTLIKDLLKISVERKKDIILVLLNEDVSNKNEDYLTVRFDDILNDSVLFPQLEVLMSRAKEDVSMAADIKKAIQKNVLKRTKAGIFFYETNLGHSEEEVKDHLLKPDNQELYLNIKSKF